MALTRTEAEIYTAGLEIQSGLAPRQGVLMKMLVEATGYSLPTVHTAVRGLLTKRHAGWPMKDKNRKKGGLRFWEVRRKA